MFVVACPFVFAAPLLGHLVKKADEENARATCRVEAQLIKQRGLAVERDVKNKLGQKARRIVNAGFVLLVGVFGAEEAFVDAADSLNRDEPKVVSPKTQ